MYVWNVAGKLGSGLLTTEWVTTLCRNLAEDSQQCLYYRQQADVDTPTECWSLGTQRDRGTSQTVASRRVPPEVTCCRSELPAVSFAVEERASSATELTQFGQLPAGGGQDSRADHTRSHWWMPRRPPASAWLNGEYVTIRGDKCADVMCSKNECRWRQRLNTMGVAKRRFWGLWVH